MAVILLLHLTFGNAFTEQHLDFDNDESNEAKVYKINFQKKVVNSAYVQELQKLIQKRKQISKSKLDKFQMWAEFRKIDIAMGDLKVKFGMAKKKPPKLKSLKE